MTSPGITPGIEKRESLKSFSRSERYKMDLENSANLDELEVEEQVKDIPIELLRR